PRTNGGPGGRGGTVVGGVSDRIVAVLTRFGTHICASVRPRICWKSGQTRTTMVSVRVTPGSVRPLVVPPAAFQTAVTVPLAPRAGGAMSRRGEATAEMQTVPTGSGSVMVKFNAALGPGLVAVIVKVNRLPAMTGSGTSVLVATAPATKTTGTVSQTPMLLVV